MKNCINIIKYNFKNYRVLYLVEGILLLIAMIAGSRFNKVFPFKILAAVNGIVAASVILIINTIVQIVLVCREVKKENGNLLFMAPIKGWEYVIAKIIEVLIVNLVIVIMSILCINIGSGVNTMLSEFDVNEFTNIKGTWTAIIEGGIFTWLGYSAWMIVLLLSIILAASYIQRTSLRVLAVLGFEIIILPIYSKIINGVVNLLPNINLVLDTGWRYNLIETAINLIVLIAVGYLASKSIENKLSII